MIQEAVALLIVENLLHFAGAFIGLSIAIIAIRGYYIIRSPTLLRLAIAFILLFAGLVFDSLIGLSVNGFLPNLALILSVLISIAAFLQASGYFFLAFSHAIDVRTSKFSVVPALAFPFLSLPAALQSLSLFFVLYGSVETGISYFRIKKKETLFIAIGLALLAASTFVDWLNFFYPYERLLALSALAAKVIGFLALFIPVLKFSFIPGVRT